MYEISNAPTRAGIVGMGIAVPPHVISQEQAEDFTRSIFASRIADFDRMAKVFPNTGIETRHLICPIDWYEADHGWADRSETFVAGAKTLYADAVAAALADADLKASDIDTIVMVCSTGIATPGIEAIMLTSMGFRQDVKRVPLFGLGCAGGVSGLSLAARLAESSDETVLIVALEICSMAVRTDQLTKANIVASALFADGAAAAIVSKAPQYQQRATFEFLREHTWPDTLDIMGWRIDDEGFNAIFSRSIPQLAKEKVPAAIDDFLNANDLTRADLDGYAFHPGGSKVLEALETSLQLEAGQLQTERAILRKYGNMSAPTALFVLRSVLEEKLSGRLLLSALGPGFTMSMITLMPGLPE